MTTEQDAFLAMARELEELHASVPHVYWQGVNPDWDGEPTGDLDKAMVRHEETVCQQCRTPYPCDTVKAIRKG